MKLTSGLRGGPFSLQVMRKDAAWVTIVREPVAQFESLWGYFEMQKVCFVAFYLLWHYIFLSCMLIYASRVICRVSDQPYIISTPLE